MTENYGIDNLKLLTEKLPTGTQKEYFRDIVNRLEKGEVVNASELIKGMENDNFKDVDIEGLKKIESKANKIAKEWASRL